jgi:hypothetical protein
MIGWFTRQTSKEALLEMENRCLHKQNPKRTLNERPKCKTSILIVSCVQERGYSSWFPSTYTSIHYYPNQPRLSISYSNHILTDITPILFFQATTTSRSLRPILPYPASRSSLSCARTPWLGHPDPISTGHIAPLPPVIPSVHRPCSGVA